MNKDILSWQKRLHAQPHVWTVYVDLEETGNFYASEEAAGFEVAFHRRTRPRARIAVVGRPLHNEELSRERWEP